jgi:glycosyltransferase involved in cell wall biosynthesis
MQDINVALIHEWFVDYSGSEKVLEQILNVFPEADLFGQVEFLPEDLKFYIKNKPVKTSFIQNLPFAKTKYRNYLPLMPLAVEQFDVSAFDIVISNSHAVSKGVISNNNQLHFCYCHSPIRYAWDLYHDYLKNSHLDHGIKGFIAKLILHYIRQWDLSTVNRIDYFIANSDYIRKRIKKIYNRDAQVIYPPVDTEKFQLKVFKEDFYVTASRLVPYKRIDFIVETFNQMPDKKLVVIGDGPDFKKIRASAGKNIELLGFKSSEVLHQYLQNAKAFIFAADEDFGILPVEAQACGTPVIALKRGGVVETVKDKETGLFYDKLNIADLKSKINQFEQQKKDFDPYYIRNHAQKFSKERFASELREFIYEKIFLWKEKGEKERVLN